MPVLSQLLTEPYKKAKSKNQQMRNTSDMAICDEKLEN